MKYIIYLLVACSIISCNKEEWIGSGSVLVTVQSPGDQLSRTLVSIKSDSSLSKELHIALEAVCGADNAVYFRSLPPGWYYIHASGYSNTRKRLVSKDTLFEIIFRTRQNDYKIDLQFTN